MNLNKINRFKSPEECARERHLEKSFPARFFGLTLIAFIGSVVVCGVFDIQPFWGVWGCLSILLWLCFLEEA